MLLEARCLLMRRAIYYVAADAMRYIYCHTMFIDATRFAYTGDAP